MHQRADHLILRTVGIRATKVKLGLNNDCIQYGEILLFDNADRIKKELFKDKQKAPFQIFFAG